MTSLYVLATTVALAAAAPTSAQTAKDALTLVPKDAFGFIVVNRLSDSSNQVAELAQQLKIPELKIPGPALLGMLKEKFGIRKSLNEKGSVVVAVLPSPTEDGVPIAIAYVPVTDYKAFLEELKAKEGDEDITEVEVANEEMVAARKGAFAVLAKRAHREVLKKALGANGGLAASVAALQPWLDENNAAACVTANGVKVLTTKVQEGLEKVKAFIPDDGKPKSKAGRAAFEMIDTFVKNVQGSVTNLGYGVKLDAGGNVHVTSRVLFANGSAFAKAFEAFESPPGGVLAGLPAQPFAVAFGAALSDQAMQRMVQLSLEMMKGALPEELPAAQLKKLEQAYAETSRGLRSMAVVLGAGKAGKGDTGGVIFRNMVAVMKVDDAPGYLDRYEKALRSIVDVSRDAKISFGAVQQIKKVKIGGLDAVEVVTDMSGKEDIPEEQKKMMELLLGSGGKVTVALAAVDKDTILVSYSGVAGLKGMLKNFKAKDGLETAPGVAKVAAMLPKGAQIVGYLSPKGIMDFAREFAPAVNMPPFPETPPIGFAARFSQAGAQGHLVVPNGVLRSIVQVYWVRPISIPE